MQAGQQCPAGRNGPPAEWLCTGCQGMPQAALWTNPQAGKNTPSRTAQASLNKLCKSIEASCFQRIFSSNTHSLHMAAPRDMHSVYRLAPARSSVDNSHACSRLKNLSSLIHRMPRPAKIHSYPRMTWSKHMYRSCCSPVCKVKNIRFNILFTTYPCFISY